MYSRGRTTGRNSKAARIFRRRWQPKPSRKFILSRGLIHYSLVCDPASFSVTGQDTGLEFGRLLAIDPASYAIIGQDVVLNSGYTIIVSPASYTVTGQNVGLESDRLMAAAPASYAVTGQDVNLESGRVLVTSPASYTVTGQAVSLELGYLIVAIPAAFVITARNVTLDYSGETLAYGVVSHWKLEEASDTREDSHGSYDLTDNNTVGQTTGKLNNAANFVLANSEYLSQSSHAGGLSIANEFPWAGHGWARISGALSTDYTLLSNGNGSSWQYELVVKSDGDLEWKVNTSGGTVTASLASAVAANTAFFWYAQYDPINDRISISINNGSLTHTALSGATVNSSASPVFTLGTLYNIGATSQYWNGWIDETTVRSNVLNSAELTTLYNSGNGLEYPWTPTAYSLVVSPASYTVTGQSVSLERGYLLATNAASYVVTGQSVSLERGYLLALGSAAYVVTGQDVSLIHGVPGAFTISAEPASFAVTGQSVGLLWGREVSAEPASYAVTGQNVGLLRGYTVIAGSAGYTVTGQDVNLEWSHLLAVAAASYTVTGQTVNLLIGYEVLASPASYVVAGQDVLLQRSRIMTASPAVFTITAQDVTLTYSGEYVPIFPANGPQAVSWVGVMAVTWVGPQGVR